MPLNVVHEGRGGYVEIDGARYPIEHISGGRFAIHFPGGRRGGDRARHREALEALAQEDPAKWVIEGRSNARGRRRALDSGGGSARVLFA